MASEKIIASANAHVVQEAPNEPWAGGDTFRINEDWNRDALVKFRLTPTVPLGTAIKSAKFFLYVDRTTAGGTEQDRTPIVQSCGNNWAENTITWNSRPPIGQQIGSMGLGVQRWKSIDVTTFVQGALGSDGIVSFYLGTAGHTQSYAGEVFYSHQRTGYEPYILVETEAPTPPPTYTCPTCGATLSSEADLDAHIVTEHPAPPAPGMLICPICGRDLGILSEQVEYVEIVSSPVIDQLLADIAALDAQILDLQGRISQVNIEIAELRGILGL